MIDDTDLLSFLLKMFLFNFYIPVDPVSISGYVLKLVLVG